MGLLNLTSSATGVTAQSVNNNTGRVKNGGSAAAGILSDSGLGLTDRTPASKVHEGRNARRAVAGGAFEYMADENFVVLGDNTTIGGVANTALASPGQDYGHSKAINQVTQVRNNYLESETWTSVGAGAVLDYTHTISSDRANFNADREADASRSAPGQFTFMTGAIVPQNNDYSAKTG